MPPQPGPGPASLHERAAATPNPHCSLCPAPCLLLPLASSRCIHPSIHPSIHRARPQPCFYQVSRVLNRVASPIPRSHPSIQFCPPPSVRCRSRSSLPSFSCPTCRSTTIHPLALSIRLLPQHTPPTSSLSPPSFALCYRLFPSSLFASVSAPHPACISPSLLPAQPTSTTDICKTRFFSQNRPKRTLPHSDVPAWRSCTHDIFDTCSSRLDRHRLS